MKRFLLRGTAVLVGTTAIALTAAPAHASVSGTLSGYPSPAGGLRPEDRAVTVVVSGRSTGAPLTDATMTVDGAPAGVAAFGCTTADCTVADAKISLTTTDYTDGMHHMLVTVRNQGGETSTVPGDIEIWNNRPSCVPPDSPPGTPCSAQLSIGSDPTAEQPSPGPGGGGGGVQGATKSSCKSPRLSMSLAQKPLRISHGVPVLLKNKRYRFTGRLTCVVNGKRRSAAKGTKIAVRNVIGKKTYRRPSTKVGNGGKITILLKYPRSRTIEFRFTNAEGKTSKVRIKVRIAKRKSHKT